MYAVNESVINTVVVVTKCYPLRRKRFVTKIRTIPEGVSMYIICVLQVNVEMDNENYKNDVIIKLHSGVDQGE